MIAMAGTPFRDCEICVIGAGPAGSTIARRLAALGHDVLVLEAARFPRPHIGESLPPSIHPVLDLAGVRGRIEGAGFLRPDAAIVRWSEPVETRRGYGAAASGFQVDRGRFDQLLLDAARAAGARVRQPARAGRPMPTARGWTVPVSERDGGGAVRARFLVDAGGKHAALARRRRRSSVPSIAVYGYWRGAGLPGPETRVEAGRRAWYWGAPLPDRSFNAVAFVDPEACAGLGRRALETNYRALLAESRLLRDCADGVLDGPVRTCDAATYWDAEPVTPTSIKVGEAAFSIDPLSSQGVQVAMASALQAAAVVHTLRTRPADTDVACEFYRARQHESVERHRRIAATLYAEQDIHRGEPFWRSRASRAAPADPPPPTVPPLRAGSRLAVSSAARIVTVPTLERDVIRRGEALDHPSLERPVAYLGDVAVAPLIRQLERGQSATRIVEGWARSLPGPRAWQILGWLWSRAIVVPAGSEPAASHAGIEARTERSVHVAR